MVFFPQVSPPKCCTRLSPPPFALHARMGEGRGLYFIYIHIYTCIRTYIYIYTYIRTYMHTYVFLKCKTPIYGCAVYTQILCTSSYWTLLIWVMPLFTVGGECWKVKCKFIRKEVFVYRHLMPVLQFSLLTFYRKALSWYFQTERCEFLFKDFVRPLIIRVVAKKLKVFGSSTNNTEA